MEIKHLSEMTWTRGLLLFLKENWEFREPNAYFSIIVCHYNAIKSPPTKTTIKL